MFRLKPKQEPIRLPFAKTHRRQRLAERQKRIELLVNRSLDRAQGFSWSADRRRRPGLGDIRPHHGIGAAAALVSTVVLLGAFLAASRHGLATVPPIIWVEATGAAAARPSPPTRPGELAEMRMRVAELESAGGPETPELRRLREDLAFERAIAEARSR